MARITNKQYVVSLEIAIATLEVGYAERRHYKTGEWLVAEDGLFRSATKIESKFLDAAERLLKKAKKFSDIT